MTSSEVTESENESTLLREVSFPWKQAGSRRRKSLVKWLTGSIYDPVSQFIHLSFVLCNLYCFEIYILLLFSITMHAVIYEFFLYTCTCAPDR